MKEHLSQPFFDDIKSGKKIYEGRLNKGKFNKDDIVIWYNDDKGDYREFTTKITNITVFNTFKEAIEKAGLNNILPSEYEKNSSIDESIQNVYRQWYNEEKEKKFGVILLQFALLS